MKKLAFAALASSVLASLAACSDKDEAMLDDAAASDAAAAMPAEETVPDAQASLAQDSTSVSVDKNGVSVDVKDGDTRVSADTDDGMSASVETK